MRILNLLQQIESNKRRIKTLKSFDIDVKDLEEQNKNIDKVIDLMDLSKITKSSDATQEEIKNIINFAFDNLNIEDLENRYLAIEEIYNEEKDEYESVYLDVYYRENGIILSFEYNSFGYNKNILISLEEIKEYNEDLYEILFLILGY